MARASNVDALEKFRFTLTYDGITRAGFHDVAIPKMTTTKGEYREGNAPDNVQLFPGLSRMEDIVLSRGTTTDQDFYTWIKLVFNPEGAGEHAMPGEDGLPQVGQDKAETPPGGAAAYRKEVTITLYNRDGSAAKSWELKNAFPVAFQPGSDLNATEDGEKSLEQLTLAYESFTETVYPSE